MRQLGAFDRGRLDDWNFLFLFLDFTLKSIRDLNGNAHDYHDLKIDPLSLHPVYGKNLRSLHFQPFLCYPKFYHTLGFTKVSVWNEFEKPIVKKHSRGFKLAQVTKCSPRIEEVISSFLFFF